MSGWRPGRLSADRRPLADRRAQRVSGALAPAVRSVMLLLPVVALEPDPLALFRNALRPVLPHGGGLPVHPEVDQAFGAGRLGIEDRARERNLSRRGRRTSPFNRKSGYRQLEGRAGPSSEREMGPVKGHSGGSRYPCDGHGSSPKREASFPLLSGAVCNRKAAGEDVGALKGDRGISPSFSHSILWSQAGSNRRPLACHASALPAEL